MSDEMIAALQRADDCIVDADILIKEERFTAVVNRSYYAVFYALSALAIKHGFETSKHQQLIGWFNKTFVKKGLVPKELGQTAHMVFERRLAGDYDFLSVCTKSEAMDIFQASTGFVEELKKHILN